MGFSLLKGKHKIMSVFINASGKRFIECNCCQQLAASQHGIVRDGLANDIAPIDWQTELLRRSMPHGGYYWKTEHFCPNCQRKA